MEPSTTLCIINYNGKAEMAMTWKAVSAIRHQFDEILVIDNGSTDGSLDYIKSLPQISVVCLAQNLGPAAARNIGFALARSDRILFQDNDISLAENTAGCLSQVLDEHPKALAVTPRVCYRHQPDTIQYDSADCHVLGMMTLRNANLHRHQVGEALSPCTSLVTACFLIDRRRWRQHNEGPLFDERLIFNFEDHDLGVRASLLGYALYCDSRTHVLHGGGTEGQSWRPGQSIPAQRIFCLTRNRWWIVMRYFSGISLLRLLPVLLMFEVIQAAGLISKGFAREWARAVLSTLEQMPLLLRQRMAYQRQRQRDDRHILRLAPLPLTSAMAPTGFTKKGLDIYQKALGAWCRWQGWPDNQGGT